jgi:hypothetical protein
LCSDSELVGFNGVHSRCVQLNADSGCWRIIFSTVAIDCGVNLFLEPLGLDHAHVDLWLRLQRLTTDEVVVLQWLLL